MLLQLQSPLVLSQINSLSPLIVISAPWETKFWYSIFINQGFQFLRRKKGMLFVCDIPALTSKVGGAAKSFSLQLAAGSGCLVEVKLSASRSKKAYCLSIYYFTFHLMLVVPLCLLCFIHFILSSRSPRLLSMLCWLPFSSSWYFFRPAAPSCYPRLFWPAWTVKGQRRKKCVPGQRNHWAGTCLPCAALVEAEHEHKAVS